MISTLISGIATTCSMYATELWHLMLARMVQGACLALIPTASLNIIRDLFPKFAQTKAFFMYQIITKCVDSMLYLSLFLINFVGWRQSYLVIGSSLLFFSIIGLLFTREPEKRNVE